MRGRAYPLSYSHDTSQEVGGVFRSLRRKVRERFSQEPKPVDHLGGISPTEQIVLQNHLFLFDMDRDLDYRPKFGTSLEEMEVRLG